MKTPNKLNKNNLAIIGINTIFTARGETENRVLGYAFHCIYRNQTWSGTMLPEIEIPSARNGRLLKTHPQRYGLQEFVEKAITAGHDRDHFTMYPKKVLLVFFTNRKHLCSFDGYHQQLVEWQKNGQLLQVHNSFYAGPTNKPHRQILIPIRHASGNYSKVITMIHDIQLLCDEKVKSPKEIAPLLGIPTVDLSALGFDSKDVQKLYDKNKDVFRTYLLEDAQIVAETLNTILNKHEQDVGRFQIRATIGAMAVDLFKATMLGNNYSTEEVFNFLLEDISNFDEDRGYTRKIKQRIVEEQKWIHQRGWSEFIHGGRNEVYEYGITDYIKDGIHDLDISSAYPLAASSLRIADTAKTENNVTDLSRVSFDSYGLFKVKFRFPAECMFPCLPQHHNSSLIYTLEGVSYATSPEILAALDMGATVEIIPGMSYVIPFLDQRLPFLQYFIHQSTERRKYNKGTYFNLYHKLMSNTLYGKVCQGFGVKRKTAVINQNPNPESDISHPIYAAYITGLIRALVSELMHNLNRAGYHIYHVTTDGFCTNAPLDVVHQIESSGPTGRYLKQFRQLLTSGTSDKLMERKTTVSQLFEFKTRIQGTAVDSQGEEVVLAKCGLTPETNSTRDDQNAWLLDVGITRTFETRNPRERTMTVKEIIDKGGDFIPVKENPRVTLDPDVKRRIISPIMKDTPANIPHIHCDTKPWQTLDEMDKYAQQWNDYRLANKACLKDIDTFNSFEEYRETGVLNPSEYLLMYIREFLKCYKQGAYSGQIGHPVRSFRPPSERSDAGCLNLYHT